MWIEGHAGEGGHNASGENGKFEIRDVGPGSYTVSAETHSETAGLFGFVEVTVREADVDGINVVLRPNPTIEGQIVVKGGRLLDLNVKRISFRSLGSSFGSGFASAQPDQDGKFALSLRPGQHTITFDSSLAQVDKVTMDGQPITNLRIQMDTGSVTKKLVIELKPKAKP